MKESTGAIAKAATPAEGIDEERRRLLVGAAAGIAFAVAPGVSLIAQADAGHRHATAVGSSRRWGLLIDTTRCKPSCTACVTACSRYNGWRDRGRPIDPQWIRKVEVIEPESGRSHSVPVMCQHCAQPACVEVCPTGASFQRADGIVLVDRHICIGCRYCMMACPYKARSFVHENLADQRPEAPRGKGTVEGCTLCVPRVDAGEQPACVEACARDGGGAMIFGDLKDPTSPIRRALAAYPSVQLRADLRMDPGVRYRGL
ncbi:MAG TPA: 4Fe-4S dicluster domain-containing protein [Steroidobacteraceae bacterium]|nr:4Fe-4S dicluster domain-containing protein [Steroidobacteraceae bacterium]